VKIFEQPQQPRIARKQKKQRNKVIQLRNLQEQSAKNEQL
jgi:hypothetical protein